MQDIVGAIRFLMKERGLESRGTGQTIPGNWPTYSATSHCESRDTDHGLQWRRNKKLSCNSQCATLVGFERNLLREHHIARHEITFWNETPALARPAIPIELDNVRAAAMLDAIGLATIATNDLEMIVVIKLLPLLRR
jgi:hypothetical protein